MNEKYRGYTITYDPPPIPDRQFDWSWIHENYDAWTDDGIWHNNGCAGQSASLEAAKVDIDEQIAETTCQEFGGWLIWETGENMWRGEPYEAYRSDNHATFVEGASAEDVRAEIDAYEDEQAEERAANGQFGVGA